MFLYKLNLSYLFEKIKEFPDKISSQRKLFPKKRIGQTNDQRIRKFRFSALNEMGWWLFPFELLRLNFVEGLPWMTQ